MTAACSSGRRGTRRVMEASPELADLTYRQWVGDGTDRDGDVAVVVDPGGGGLGVVGSRG